MESMTLRKKKWKGFSWNKRIATSNVTCQKCGCTDCEYWTPISETDSSEADNKAVDDTETTATVKALCLKCCPSVSSTEQVRGRQMRCDSPKSDCSSTTTSSISLKHKQKGLCYDLSLMRNGVAFSQWRGVLTENHKVSGSNLAGKDHAANSLKK